MRDFDHDYARTDFRWRQRSLIASAAWSMGLYFICGYSLLLLIAVTFIQTATDEARRYRRTGCRFQTRRSIWKGTTPIDAAKRHLLGDWNYPNAAALKSPERVEG